MQGAAKPSQSLDMALDASTVPATLGGMAAPVTPHATTFGSVPADFLCFLDSIDAANALSSEQYVKIAECFMANDICSQVELIGVEWADLETGGPMLALGSLLFLLHVLASAGDYALSAGMRGFMRRAVKKSNERLVEACGNAALVEPRAALCEADGVRALINVIKKEEITVSVDIASKVQVSARLA